MRPRPLRRVTTIWAAGRRPDTTACATALADELPSVRLADAPPKLDTLRLLHVHHDDDGPADPDLCAYLLEAKLTGIPVVLTEHVVGSELRAWERDADVLVVASEAAAERLRRRWPAKRIDVLPLRLPEARLAPRGALHARTRQRSGRSDEESPWRALELVESIRGSSLLVLAPRAEREREDAWREAAAGPPVTRDADAPRRPRGHRDPGAKGRCRPVLGARRDRRACFEHAAPRRSRLRSPDAHDGVPRFADVAAATYQPRELAGGIEELFDDDTLRVELRERARAYCTDHSWADIARQHLELWHSFDST